MDKKIETILIRLDKKTKEEFKLYCESNRLTMTDVVLEQIRSVLIKDDYSDKYLNKKLMKKESDFLKSRLREYKEAYAEINKTIVSLNRSYEHNSYKMYSSLFIEYFSLINQFNEYTLLDDKERDNWPDLIAINKKTGHKLCIEIVNSLGYYTGITFPKKDFIRKRFQNHGNNNEMQIVIISIQTLNDNSFKTIEKLSKDTNYEIKLYSIDDLLNSDK